MAGTIDMGHFWWKHSPEGKKALDDLDFLQTLDQSKLSKADKNWRYIKTAWDQYNIEAPIRQQENIARASIDLGLENTPEVIAGGTAKTMRQRQRSLYGGALGSGSIASSLGLNL